MLSRTTDTITLVPRMHAFPWQTRGSTLIRSRQLSILRFYAQSLLLTRFGIGNGSAYGWKSRSIRRVRENAASVNSIRRTPLGNCGLRIRALQVLVGETSWRFKSSHPHQSHKDFFLLLRLTPTGEWVLARLDDSWKRADNSEYQETVFGARVPHWSGLSRVAHDSLDSREAPKAAISATTKAWI